MTPATAQMLTNSTQNAFTQPSPVLAPAKVVPDYSYVLSPPSSSKTPKQKEVPASTLNTGFSPTRQPPIATPISDRCVRESKHHHAAGGGQKRKARLPGVSSHKLVPYNDCNTNAPSSLFAGMHGLYFKQGQR